MLRHHLGRPAMSQARRENLERVDQRTSHLNQSAVVRRLKQLHVEANISTHDRCRIARRRACRDPLVSVLQRIDLACSSTLGGGASSQRVDRSSHFAQVVEFLNGRHQNRETGTRYHAEQHLRLESFERFANRSAPQAKIGYKLLLGQTDPHGVAAVDERGPERRIGPLRHTRRELIITVNRRPPRRLPSMAGSLVRSSRQLHRNILTYINAYSNAVGGAAGQAGQRSDRQSILARSRIS